VCLFVFFIYLGLYWCYILGILILCRVVCLLQWLKGRVGQKRSKKEEAFECVNSLLFIWSVLGYAESLLIIMTEPLSAPSSFCKYCNFWYSFSSRHATPRLVSRMRVFEFLFILFIYFLVTSTFFIFSFFCVNLLDCFLLVIELLQ